MIAGTQVHEFMNLGEVGGGRWELASPVPPHMNMAVGLNLKVAFDFLFVEQRPHVEHGYHKTCNSQ